MKRRSALLIQLITNGVCISVAGVFAWYLSLDWREGLVIALLAVLLFGGKRPPPGYRLPTP